MKNDMAGDKSRKNTVDAVARKAMTDPAFWKKLRQDKATRTKALTDAGLDLDAQEYARLEAILARDGKTFTVDLDKTMSRIHAQLGVESAAAGSGTGSGGGTGSGSGGDGGVGGFGGLTWVGMWDDPEGNVRPDPRNEGVKKPR